MKPDGVFVATDVPRQEAAHGCPACGYGEAAALFELPDRLVRTPGLFRYRRCLQCAAVFQDPRVVRDDLPLCYPDAYYRLPDRPVERGRAARSPDRERRLGRLRDALRVSVQAAVLGIPLASRVGQLGRFLACLSLARTRAYRDVLPDELLPRTPRPGRALDIGCGTGALVAALASVGWEAEGVEWNATAAETARQRTGRPIHTGDIMHVALPGGVWQLVVLRHVLEHLADPAAVLRRIAALLCHGGQAVAFLPHAGSLGARCYGADWFAWDPPRHLWVPSIRSLYPLASRAGLSVVRATTSADGAAELFAFSRSVRAGRRVDQVRPSTKNSDHALAALERVLVALRIGAGEQITLVLAAADASFR